jgi:EAL domain-containing protein (putative c-di-GMP-specific phosphodiesterase class I)
VLKIDRSFVGDLPLGASSATLIASVIQLAGTLGLEVVAEGVETEEQRQALAELDCGHAQGYLFARPQPADQILLPAAAGNHALATQPAPVG